MNVTNQVRQARTRRGLSAAEIAERVGVSRQTIHAIESGAYAPNTAVALKLARELGVGVEDLFQLAQSDEPARVEATLAGEQTYPGAPLRLCRVGERVVAIPWSPEAFVLPAADGIALGEAHSGMVEADLRGSEPIGENRLLLSGCDPAASLLAEHLRRAAGVELMTASGSSRRSLERLSAGLAHVAGSHLGDSAPMPLDCRVFTFAEWEEGIVTAPGNPLKLRSLADLGREGMRLINREAGAGSRALLDAGLVQAGIDPGAVEGYDRFAAGHLAAAWAIRRGDADCCVAPRVAAQVFGLGFVPLEMERYDLVIPQQWMSLPAVQALLDALQRASFRRDLEALGGYDTASTGEERPTTPSTGSPR